ncbi:MAG TPA: hypothetical protein VKS78_15610 [Roseiarcus sp.]|nr:hypothetical protein [Roseiarcus sp.]
MTISPRNQVKCRQIEDGDREAVVDCLTRGFPRRSRAYWVAALDRLAHRPPLADYPKYGLLVECQAKVVGVLLQIFSRRGEGEDAPVFCNLSSWCLDPGFRGFAIMLNARATARKEVTYLNVSPAPHTWRGIEALGFRRYCEGHFVCAPVMSLPKDRGVRVRTFAEHAPEAARLSAREREILAEHAALGCRSLVVAAGETAHPFVLAPRRILHGLIPCHQLIYCRDVADFSRFAGPIGRYLLARGGLICLVDANGRAPGLVGTYLSGRGPKYFKGPGRPNLGDLSFTEFAIFGH